MTGIIILCILIASTFIVHFRGKVRFGFARQLTDHSTFFAPFNCLFYQFSKVPNKNFIDLNLFPELQIFKDHYDIIKNEALALHDASQIKRSDQLDDLGFNSFFKTGWKRFYLKWYGATLPSANLLCPKTVELINKLPNVKGAMFSMLPPGARLVQHRDPYAGSLRYHLGLSTPNHNDCYIDVDGEKYSWRDGEAVMFDETFLHYAENKTDQNRIILFLDIKRPVSFWPVDVFNSIFSKIVLAASATKNLHGDKVGVLNKLFKYVYQIRILGKKIKAYNQRIYYLIKYLLLGGIIYLLIVKPLLHKIAHTI